MPSLSWWQVSAVCWGGCSKEENTVAALIELKSENTGTQSRSASATEAEKVAGGSRAWRAGKGLKLGGLWLHFIPAKALREQSGEPLGGKLTQKSSQDSDRRCQWLWEAGQWARVGDIYELKIQRYGCEGERSTRNVFCLFFLASQFFSFDIWWMRVGFIGRGNIG